MSKLHKSLVVAILLTGVLAGCGGKIEETYVLTSLKNAASRRRGEHRLQVQLRFPEYHRRRE